MFRNNRFLFGFTLLAALALILAACAQSTTAPTATAAANQQLPNTGATEVATSPTTQASQTPILTVQSNPTLGNILADSKEMTLYIFTKDTSDTSTCYDQCEAKWPPLVVSSGMALNAGSGVNATLSTTQRTDGSMQLTVNGMPVYYYFQDSKPGDTNGQGVGGAWFVLDASGNMIKK